MPLFYVYTEAEDFVVYNNNPNEPTLALKRLYHIRGTTPGGTSTGFLERSYQSTSLIFPQSDLIFILHAFFSVMNLSTKYVMRQMWNSAGMEVKE